MTDHLTLSKFQALTSKHPTRLPVYVQESSDGVAMTKRKFLVPREFTAAQLLLSIRHHCIDIKESEALYMLCGSRLFTASTTVQDMWQFYKDRNAHQFLVVTVTKESTFG